MKSLKLFISIMLLSFILIINQGIYAEQNKSILVVGDSIGKGIGDTLKKAFTELKINVNVQNSGVVSSGLLSPNFYNWNRSLAEFLEKNQYDYIIVSLGTNDIRKESGNDKWKDMYKQKIKEFLSLMNNNQTQVYVLSVPPMRDEPFKSHTKDINQILQAVIIELGGNYKYVDVIPDISINGEYCKNIRINGKEIRIRTDGIHFTPFGYNLLGKVIAVNMNQSSKGNI